MKGTQQTQGTQITIVIPARNEKEGIARTIKAIPKAELEQMGYEVQILIVDSSTDNTGELAKKAGAEVVYEPRLGAICLTFSRKGSCGKIG